MLKKYILMLLLSGLLVLAACANGDSEADNPAEAETEDTETATENHPEDSQTEDSDTETKVPAEPEEEEQEADQIADKDSEILYELDESSWNLVPLEEGTEENVVLLTIDDAPDTYALEMAKTLKELDAPAIFFVNGHFLQSEEDKEALKEIHEMGFAIGNHTYNHQQLSVADEETQKREIIELSDEIEEIIGERPEFFRAPHGDNTDFAKEVVKEEGMLLMNWTYGYDYFEPYMDENKIREAMITGEAPEVDIDYSLLQPGANLLMHDREWTAAALADIVEGLREQGYEMADPYSIKRSE
ncbi:polysaccharide deacetylase family protein [Gracilibacillus alcaliphilus]|uniref:polysaccharide deacetylase family protein n=1 Tax=Gracilibacillus alcaliphilus TaxID=1401441 RepID=UPI001EF9020F|nr:polysaccharide deacetylase family protein [Gracilibacillus alcaliphilus]MBM7678667.1 peptidoglycan/xylan/chitin deacetylase (PgdA/CDA1 family) [Gracilibacillus alcaliphilus]